MNKLGIFRSEFRENQAVSDDIQTRIDPTKEDLQNSTEKGIPQNKTTINHFGWTATE